MEVRNVTSDYAAQIKQAARAGVAAVLALSLARLIHLPESYWAAISAIIVTFSDVGQTIRASWTRLVGTAAGVTMGAAFTALFGPRMWGFGVAVTLTMLLCALLGFAEASRLAGVSVAIVMLASRQGAPWATALHRFLEVSLGIVTAVGIATLRWPVRKADRA
jgi:uncharacterized membrane protein YgaE (UPF0421/DUF939 family)